MVTKKNMRVEELRALYTEQSKDLLREQVEIHKKQTLILKDISLALKEMLVALPFIKDIVIVPYTKLETHAAYLLERKYIDARGRNPSTRGYFENKSKAKITTTKEAIQNYYVTHPDYPHAASYQVLLCFNKVFDFSSELKTFTSFSQEARFVDLSHYLSRDTSFFNTVDRTGLAYFLELLKENKIESDCIDTIFYYFNTVLNTLDTSTFYTNFQKGYLQVNPRRQGFYTDKVRVCSIHPEDGELHIKLAPRSLLHNTLTEEEKSDITANPSKYSIRRIQV